MQKYSDATLKNVVSHFIEEDSNFSFSPLTNGLINTTFLATTNKIPKYIIQRINTAIFPNVEGLMQNITNGLSLLDHKEYATITFLKKRETKLIPIQMIMEHGG